MFFRFYNFLLFFFLPLILLFFLMRFFFSKETKQSIIEKFLFSKYPRPPGKLIWINGVSIGEAKSGLTIAKEFLVNRPDCNVLLSTSTISAYNEIAKQKEKIILIYLPIDIGFLIKKFIKHWKPDLTIFMESEIWPNIIKELNKNKLRFTILNARMSNKSFFWWKTFNFFTKHVFRKVSSCTTQDEISRNRFEELGVQKVECGSNIKFFNSKLNFKERNIFSLKKKLAKHFIITFFSTHKNEEIILIECFKLLNKKFKNLMFVIIPRHLKNTGAIKKNLEKNNFSFGIRSLNQSFNKKYKFYIADTFGELGLFFSLSKVSIVGGSFSNKGGHNPIEASHFNCAVIFGPNMKNFKEIKEKILKTKSGFQVNNSSELAEKISTLITKKNLLKITVNNFKKLQIKEAKKVKILIQQECAKI